MSWVAVGVGVGTTALSLGGNAIIAANSGGGGVNSGSIQNTLQNYLGQVNAAVESGRTNINRSVRGMDRKIAGYTTELRNASDAETRNFWNNLGIYNNNLINSASALVEEYDGDVERALTTLQTNINRLNEGYASDMGAEINRYGSAENALNATLAQDEQVAEESFLRRVNQAQTDYRAETGAEIDAAKAEQMSLGDTFLQKSNEAMGKFESFLSTANTASTLDDLSKKLQQTRLDMLATADPRAAELSAIADENAAAMMSGRISADVQANLARSGAMRALQGGFGAGSGMGRNLQARDLGLTSLDLMGKGYDMFDRQRRLNYDTKVAGIEDAAVNAFGQMRAGQQGLMETAIGTAESDRNQRVGAVQEASGQRLQTFDKLFGSNLTAANALREQDMTLASTLNANARDTNIRATGMRMAATQDIYNNNLGLADTVFNTGIGLAGQKFSTGLSVAGDVYKTNVGGANTTYTTRLNLENNIFGTRSNAAVSGMNAQTAYEAEALRAATAALGNAAATQTNIPIMNAAMRQAGANASAQMWGSALQAGSSLAGSYLGNSNWNPGGRSFGMSASQMTGSTIPGTTGSYQSWAGGYVPRATAA